MGEYANYQGNHVKIGTCEDMLYLRADQAYKVTAERGSVDPVRDFDGIRFRFPFPDEDTIRPGEFEDPFRKLAVHGAEELLKLISPDSHHSVQFTSSHGYVLSVPCPEIQGRAGLVAAEGLLTLTDGSEHAYRVGRNGFKGSLFVSQQRYWEGALVVVVECACGAKFRLETLEIAEPLLVALRSEADRLQQLSDRHPSGPTGVDGGAQFLNEIADRVTAGYSASQAV